MGYLKFACGLVCFLILISNVRTISRWSESRGVYDDICYLRQAHLFERFGLGGLDTDMVRDDDRYFTGKLKEINFPTWNDVTTAPCHVLMPASNKRVLQYPPGTGFMLALFPSGFQVIPLYVLASAAIFGVALIALAYAATLYSLSLAGIFGIVAMYLMINPTKASYSVAPTMIVCALTGFLTAKLFAGATRHKILLAAAIGLLIGLSVNFRLPNLLLLAGYGLFFLVAFLMARNRESFGQGLWFGVALLIGMTPTLIANAINAGSPFATTYGDADVVPPELKSGVIWQYFVDAQFSLLLIAAVWTGLLWRFHRRSGTRRLTLVVAGNLVVNLLFFMSHPIFTPYYTIPIAMLSLWTLLFATLDRYGERAADNPVSRQPAQA
jgi:hypothetical protein